MRTLFTGASQCEGHPLRKYRGAARMVAESGRDDVAALSSRACRELYGLDCLAASVQDQGNNFTRFICIAKNLEIYPGADRTSLMMVLPHHPGSLYKVALAFQRARRQHEQAREPPDAGPQLRVHVLLDLETSVYAPQFTQLMGELPSCARSSRILALTVRWFE